MGDQNLFQFVGEKQEVKFTLQDDDGNDLDLTAGDVQDVFLVVATGLKQFGEIQFEKTGTQLTANGGVEFIIEEADTENLRPGNYLYEVYVEYNGSSNYTAEVGKFFVKPRVDR